MSRSRYRPHRNPKRYRGSTPGERDWYAIAGEGQRMRESERARYDSAIGEQFVAARQLGAALLAVGTRYRIAVRNPLVRRQRRESRTWTSEWRRFKILTYRIISSVEGVLP